MLQWLLAVVILIALILLQLAIFHNSALVLICNQEVFKETPVVSRIWEIKVTRLLCHYCQEQIHMYVYAHTHRYVKMYGIYRDNIGAKLIGLKIFSSH